MISFFSALKAIPAAVEALLGLISAVELAQGKLDRPVKKSPKKMNRRFSRRVTRKRPRPLTHREVVNGQKR